MTSAAIYLRISRDPYLTGSGVRRQEEDCRAWADRNGARITDVYTDNDSSAYSGRRRPQYIRLCEDMAEGRVDGVIVWHLDRLHRSPLELEEFITLVERHRVEVVTITGGNYDLSRNVSSDLRHLRFRRSLPPPLHRC